MSDIKGDSEVVSGTVAGGTRGDFAATALVVLMVLILFYLPSVLTIFSQMPQSSMMKIMSISMATAYAGIFCLNYFWLVPRSLFRDDREDTFSRFLPHSLFRDDRKAAFFIINASIILFVCITVPAWFEAHGGLPHPPRPEPDEKSYEGHLVCYLRFMLRDGIMMLLSVALAYATRLTRERDLIRRRRLELDAERRSLELRSLRAQLNPHFLFNSLNNIYALIAISPDNAQAALHDLSGMLRFMIYDASAPNVPLEKELRFISDYVALMRLRLRSSMTLTCDISIRCTGTPVIAPMLLLTLVENAFKHSAPDGPTGFISITVTADDLALTCILTNTCTPEDTSTQSISSGVGLTNIRRQLNLLYPGAYTLTTVCEGTVYRAELRIDATALTPDSK
ncbi:MAG: sensor histidine kinase [Muribaculaceae bacterium]|nr:sensor histidine kinase [Muribaculaceae bacterium]